MIVFENLYTCASSTVMCWTWRGEVTRLTRGTRITQATVMFSGILVVLLWNCTRTRINYFIYKTITATDVSLCIKPSR
jgi:hypothetical protein